MRPQSRPGPTRLCGASDGRDRPSWWSSSAVCLAGGVCPSTRLAPSRTPSSTNVPRSAVMAAKHHNPKGYRPRQQVHCSASAVALTLGVDPCMGADGHNARHLRTCPRNPRCDFSKDPQPTPRSPAQRRRTLAGKSTLETVLPNLFGDPTHSRMSPRRSGTGPRLRSTTSPMGC